MAGVMGSKALGIVRNGAIALIGVLAILWLGVWLGFFDGAREPGGNPNFGMVSVKPFHLIDHMGRAVDERSMLGRPAAVFFGFTHCPDVCPTTLTSLSAAMARLGTAADRIGVFFVTVDPARDTPEALKDYLSPFDPRISGLTGAPDQIASLAKSLGVYHARMELEGGGYTMDHTASIFLLDAQGRFAGTIAYGEDGDAALAKLRTLARGP